MAQHASTSSTSLNTTSTTIPRPDGWTWLASFYHLTSGASWIACGRRRFTKPRFFSENLEPDFRGIVDAGLCSSVAFCEGSTFERSLFMSWIVHSAKYFCCFYWTYQRSICPSWSKRMFLFWIKLVPPLSSLYPPKRKSVFQPPQFLKGFHQWVSVGAQDVARSHRCFFWFSSGVVTVKKTTIWVSRWWFLLASGWGTHHIAPGEFL